MPELEVIRRVKFPANLTTTSATGTTTQQSITAVATIRSDDERIQLDARSVTLDFDATDIQESWSLLLGTTAPEEEELTEPENEQP